MNLSVTYSLFVLFIGLAPVGAAQPPQPFVCTSSASVVPIVRVEGLAEPVGDFQLTCTGGTPTAAGQRVPSATFSLAFNTTLTSKVTARNQLTEALLLIDEPNSPYGVQRPVLNCGQYGAPDNGPSGPGVCAIVGTGVPAQTYDGTPNGYGPSGAFCNNSGGRPPSHGYGCGRPNVFQGRTGTPQNSRQANAVTFLNVPVDAPGAASRTFRFTNLRVDASAVGASSTFTLNQIQVSISVSGQASPFIANPVQVAGYVNRGLLFSPSGLSVASNSVRVIQGFASAWKAKNLAMAVGNNGVPGNATFGSLTIGGITYVNMWSYNGGTHYPADVAQNVPVTVYNTESLFQWQNNTINGPPVPNPPPGFGSIVTGPNQGTPLGSIGYGGLDTGIRSAGVADAGTRIGLRFNNASASAQVTLPTVVDLIGQHFFNPKLVPVGVMVLTHTDSNGAGPFHPYGLTPGFANIPARSMAVYEVLYTDPFSLVYADIPLRLSTGQSLAAAGVGVTVSFAPFSSNRGEHEDDNRDENARAPVPRFVATPAPVQP